MICVQDVRHLTLASATDGGDGNTYARHPPPPPSSRTACDEERKRARDSPFSFPHSQTGDALTSGLINILGTEYINLYTKRHSLFVLYVLFVFSLLSWIPFVYISFHNRRTFSSQQLWSFASCSPVAPWRGHCFILSTPRPSTSTQTHKKEASSSSSSS